MCSSLSPPAVGMRQILGVFARVKPMMCRVSPRFVLSSAGVLHP